MVYLKLKLKLRTIVGRLCVWCVNACAVVRVLDEFFFQVQKLCTNNITQNVRIQLITTLTLESDLKQMHNQLNKNDRMTAVKLKGTKENEPNGMHGLSLGFSNWSLSLCVLWVCACASLLCVFSAFINSLTIVLIPVDLSAYARSVRMELNRKENGNKWL